jgi:hypothetical protein
MNLAENSRYVILKHTTPKDTHFDFMLETGDHLSTWRINIGPEELKTTPAKAEKIFDHKLKFLTYQGPVNNGPGNVTTADKGTYSIITQTSEKLQIQIDANILSGTYTLQQKTKNTWQITPQ